MSRWNHLLELSGVSHYRAPEGVEIRPWQIPPGQEYVELLTSGGVWFNMSGHDEAYTAGTIFWHRTGDWTIHRSLPRMPYQCMCFRFSVTDEVPLSPPARVSQWNDARAAVAFCWEAFQSIREGSFDRRTLGEMVYSRLLWEGRPSASPAGAEAPDSVLRALMLVEEWLHDDFRISDLAREAGVSVPHLHALFRAKVGQTPRRYVLEQKLLYACHLLRGSAQSVKVVSTACGFANVETFCRVFRKSFGQTPSEYRHAAARQRGASA